MRKMYVTVTKTGEETTDAGRRLQEEEPLVIEFSSFGFVDDQAMKLIATFTAFFPMAIYI